VPYIVDILKTIHPPTETGIEDMVHGYHIGKVGLVVGDKEYPLIRQGADNLRAIYKQMIEASITAMGQRA